MKRKKRGLACILIAVMLLTVLPVGVVCAATETLDVSNGSIVITATGYSQAGAVEIPHTDDYSIISAGTTSNTVQVLSGTHSIELKNVEISTAASTAAMGIGCAFSIQGTGTDVSISLVGNNTLTSSRGYAGIHVSEGTSLTIAGNGSLTAKGGNGTTSTSTPFAAGAGIGGSGYASGSRFGSIVINSGTINATGGATGTSASASVFGAELEQLTDRKSVV